MPPKLIGLLIALALAVVLLLEASARVAFTLYAGGALQINYIRESESFYFTSDVGWDRRPKFAGKDSCGAYRAFDEKGILSVDAEQLRNKSPGTHTVAFVGDSNTYGYCLDTPSTFVEVFDRLTPNTVAVNLGMSGYSSYQGYRALLKYGDLIKPEIVVIAFNFNDRRYARQPDGDAAFRLLDGISQTPAFADRIYLVRAVRSLGKKLGFIAAAGEAQDAAPRRIDEIPPRVSPQDYRANLVKMVEWTKQRNGTPIFVLMGDNPAHTTLVNLGASALAQRDYEKAIRYLTYAMVRPKTMMEVVARQHLAKAYKELGQEGKADETLRMTFNFGGWTDGGVPLFPDTDYNKIMLDVANAHGITVVDAKSELEKTPRVFFDTVHFDQEGHETVGRMLRDALIKLDNKKRL
jgi:lysophospholipase L1-like esterase